MGQRCMCGYVCCAGVHPRLDDIFYAGIFGGELRNGDRRVVGGLHYGGDASAQASVYGVKHGADAASGGTIHREAVGGRFDVRHEQ